MPARPAPPRNCWGVRADEVDDRRALVVEVPHRLCGTILRSSSSSGIWDERKVKGRRSRDREHVRWIGLRSGLVRLDLVDGLLAWADALLRV